MQTDEQKAAQTWIEGGFQIGLDFGKAIPLIYVTGLIKGLTWFLPKKPEQEQEEANPNDLRWRLKNWRESLNKAQKAIVVLIELLEKVFLNPLKKLGDNILGPAFATLFAGVAILPGRIKGKSNISLRQTEYHWAMQFVEKHAGKVALMTLILASVGFLLGFLLPFVTSSKVAITAYFLGMFFLPPILSHLFLGTVAFSHGLWHLFASLLTKQSEAERVKWTYRGKHLVDRAFAKEQPEVAARLNQFFSMQMETTAEYTRQEALQRDNGGSDRPILNNLRTVAGLQKEQDAFLEELKGMKPKNRMAAIAKKEYEFKKRVTFA